MRETPGKLHVHLESTWTLTVPIKKRLSPQNLGKRDEIHKELRSWLPFDFVLLEHFEFDLRIQLIQYCWS